jgi:hypothetical protein
MRKTLVIADEVFAQRFYPIVLGKDVLSEIGHSCAAGR